MAKRDAFDVLDEELGGIQAAVADEVERRILRGMTVLSSVGGRIVEHRVQDAAVVAGPAPDRGSSLHLG